VTITIPGTVRISKPLDQPLAEVMSRMRDWLDQNKIQPALFRQIADATGIDGFEIRFAEASDAHV
jgi:phosphoribosyl-dephospho-CoA transferase